QIMAINPNLSSQLFIDQEIKIPRTENSKGYIEHLVSARKEKLKDIALAYDVPVSNLIDLNPGAPSKIRRGETVYIPVDFIDKKEDDEADDVDLEIPVEDRPIAVTPEFFTDNKNKVFNVALMLPLYLSEVDSMLQVAPTDLLTHRQELNAFRFIEFYEGAQIAVDSLRKTGMKLNFHVYDVTDNEAETAMLLQDRALKKMDLIISLLYSKSFALVSNFSRSNRIPLVNVLSKRGQIVYENPYVVKMSPKPDGMYQRVADFVGENFANYNTILVRNNPYQLSNEFNLLSGLLREEINPKAPLSNYEVLQKIDTFMQGRQNTFLDTLNQELVKNDYTLRLNDIIERPYDTSWVNNNLKTVIYSSDSLAGIMRKASLFRDNLVVALGGDEVFAIELLTRLNFVRDSFNFKVIGLPDWHNFDKVDVNYSQPVSLRVLSADFVDYRSQATRKFIAKFKQAYNKVPEIETYAFLGYDATYYFLHALLRYGDDMLENLPNFQIPLLENQLKFEKQGRGGYENMYWNLYRQENYHYILEK
ncbi:MAG: LysM peptidoglycan-binding domain-containing protein, partial [Bacteroidales bacterium]|nr:LysM peptidoglycan-binding domain-containing protein [Bacteroidales bacterium]